MSGAEPPLTVFHPWSKELTSPSRLPVTGPPPAVPLRVPGSGDRSSVRRAGRGRPGKRRPRAAHTGRASAVNVGRVRCAREPNLHRERGPSATVQLGRACFRPSGSRFKFSIF
jgi:hypothetical protein